MNRVDNNNINKQRRMRESGEYKLSPSNTVEYTVMISGCVRFYATVEDSC